MNLFNKNYKCYINPEPFLDKNNKEIEMVYFKYEWDLFYKIMK